MARRDTVSLVGVLLCALPAAGLCAPAARAVALEAPPRGHKLFRVGVLSLEPAGTGAAASGPALLNALKGLRYVEGENLGVDALLVLEDPLFALQRVRLAALAVQAGLPTVYGLREYVDTGGLLGYGPNRRELFRQAAGYVDRILKGARPRDLPVQQPSKLDLVVNRAPRARSA